MVHRAPRHGSALTQRTPIPGGGGPHRRTQLLGETARRAGSLVRQLEEMTQIADEHAVRGLDSGPVSCSASPVPIRYGGDVPDTPGL
ncbi:hypothetical protein RAJCM14343_1922 [Rhodococcus aetherivorans]|uniref:Uncharacterized protein n=1 Tax=Rhodococcus aetherivorans TaxID=191292 RepID=A0ABQ0YJE4_9NOCA|nr:hypothetical protein RAJCM14343_1922 [Rhodococcus aetherivorans]